MVVLTMTPEEARLLRTFLLDFVHDDDEVERASYKAITALDAALGDEED